MPWYVASLYLSSRQGRDELITVRRKADSELSMAAMVLAEFDNRRIRPELEKVEILGRIRLARTQATLVPGVD